MYQKIPPLEKTYNKTLLIIESCKTKEQLEGASIMVKNFKTLYKMDQQQHNNKDL